MYYLMAIHKYKRGHFKNHFVGRFKDVNNYVKGFKLLTWPLNDNYVISRSRNKSE